MVLLINCLVVAIVVLIHYEFLYRFTRMIPKMKIRHRFRIVAGVFSALIAHTIEVFIFAVTSPAKKVTSRIASGKRSLIPSTAA